MKKALTILFAVTASLTLAAQNYDVDKIVASDWHYLAGVEGPYRFDNPAPSPSPKGYTPFYISHYGRHGSRYSWTSSTYTTIKNVLDSAAKADAFNEVGKQFYKDYNDFYFTPYINEGDLTELGWQQHQRIAKEMVENFPQVFAKGGKVLAQASTSQRAIVSMAGFVSSLERNAPKIDVVGNSLHANMLFVNPPSAPRDLMEYHAGTPKFPAESGSDFKKRKYAEANSDAVLAHIFKDTKFLEEQFGERGTTNFLTNLFVFWEGYKNYCNDNRFDHLFTTEQAVKFWEYENYNSYLTHSNNRYNDIPLLRDIVDCANEAIATGNYIAHLRFGHDTVVNAIVPLLNLNGTGTTPDSADEVKLWFQNYNCPMASNLQFVLYRSKKKNADILFKVLWNGAEATIPQLTAVQGPYYKWSDFVAWAEQIYKDHPVIPAPVRRAPSSSSFRAPAPGQMPGAGMPAPQRQYPM